jgi:hypothetical protein
MAIGDQNDIVSRIFRWLPARWFPSNEAATLVYAVVNGLAAGLASIYSMVAYAALQVRIATATDGFLDLIAGDFFGPNLPRKSGELDPLYSARIRREIMRERVTREAIDRVVYDTTGNHPTIIELDRVSDIGGYRQGFAYGVGSYGSKGAPFQVFVTTPRQNPIVFPLLAGYRAYCGGYRSPYSAYALPSIFPAPQPPDAAIIAAIESVRAAGITVWLHLTDVHIGLTPTQTVGKGALALNQATESGFNLTMGMT